MSVVNESTSEHFDPQCMNASLSGQQGADHDDQQISGENMIGVVIAIIANSIIPIGLNLQKFAHTRNTNADGRPIKPITKIPVWWVGLLSMAGGEIFNLLAYGYSPTSLVAPVGAIGVLVNALIATLCMKETFGLKDGVGLLAIATGVVMVVTTVPEVQLDIRHPEQLVEIFSYLRARLYLLIVCIFVPLWGFLVVPKHKDKHPIVYLMMCSVIASLTVVASRAFASILTRWIERGMDYEGFTRLFSWVPFLALVVIVITGVWSTAYLQKAMALFPNNKVVPVYYVTFTLSSVSAGAICYFEFDCMTFIQMLLFACGCAVTFVGIFVTAGNRKEAAPSDGTSSEGGEGPGGNGEGGSVEGGSVEGTAYGSNGNGNGGRRGSWFTRRRIAPGLRANDSAARRHVELLDEPAISSTSEMQPASDGAQPYPSTPQMATCASGEVGADGGWTDISSHSSQPDTPVDTTRV